MPNVPHRCVRELLEHWGASVDLQSADGFTPLLETVYAGYHATARVLLQAGAQHNVRITGPVSVHMGALTAAEWARQRGHPDMADLIDGFHAKRHRTSKE